MIPHVLKPFDSILRRIVLFAMFCEILDKGGEDSFEFGACGWLHGFVTGIGMDESGHVACFASAAL